MKERGGGEKEKGGVGREVESYLFQPPPPPICREAVHSSERGVHVAHVCGPDSSCSTWQMSPSNLTWTKQVRLLSRITCRASVNRDVCCVVAWSLAGPECHFPDPKFACGMHVLQHAARQPTYNAHNMI